LGHVKPHDRVCVLLAAATPRQPRLCRVGEFRPA